MNFKQNRTGMTTMPSLSWSSSSLEELQVVGWSSLSLNQFTMLFGWRSVCTPFTYSSSESNSERQPKKQPPSESSTYFAAWCTAKLGSWPQAWDTPSNDLQLLQELKEFHTTTETKAKEVFTAFKRHLRYLMPQMIPLSLFGNNADPSEKSNIVHAMKEDGGHQEHKVTLYQGKINSRIPQQEGQHDQNLLLWHG